MEEERRQELIELLELADKGDAFAQNMLAARLASGYFMEQDNAGAFYWYCQAMKQGYTHSKWNAGTMILAGEVNKELGEKIGLRLIEEAAEDYENSACLFISDCYFYGNYGVEKDIQQANDWKRKSWEIDKFKEYGQPIDLEMEYSITVQKPALPYI